MKGDLNYNVIYNHKDKEFYYQNIICFDTETTSVKINEFEEDKIAFVYAYIFSVNGEVTILRNEDDFISFIEELVQLLDSGNGAKQIIYVHNLKYDFQFIRKLFKWDKIFALKKRSIVYAIYKNLIFKCSYVLSAKSLEKIGEEVGVKKLLGNLDYSLVRLPTTELTDKEIEYMEHDVLVMDKYIKKQISIYGNISRIPNTNTGRVRQFLKEKAIKSEEYMKLLRNLKLSPKEYAMCKSAFTGGFTHANHNAVGRLYENVMSYDITSSYPTVMISEYYPMSSPIRIKCESLEKLLEINKKFLTIFDIKITNIRAKIDYEHLLSESKCWIVGELVSDNGRIVSVNGTVCTTITNVDLNSLLEFYDYDKIEIGEVLGFIPRRLPKIFIETILELYEKKTKLKDLEGKEDEYLLNKGMLNSLFGMSVTDILRDDILYEDDIWSISDKMSVEDKLERYNEDKYKFLYYPWGVFVTAYARRRLILAIEHLSDSYIYSDTDSVKFISEKADTEYFEQESKFYLSKLKETLKHYNIPEEKLYPKNIKGEEKPLGIWEFEDNYKEFKTLGAKRYLLLDSKDNLKLTVSGIPKKWGSGYLSQFKNPFKLFDNKLRIPKEYRYKDGDKTYFPKPLIVYIDDEKEAVVVDYKGDIGIVNSKSGVYMTEQDATLSLSKAFIEYLKRNQSKTGVQ